MVSTARALGFAGCVAATLAVPACTPASAREEAFVRDQIASLPGVEAVQVSCGTGWLSAQADVCVTVKVSGGRELKFANVGYDSFGSAPSSVHVTAAGGRSPLIVSCNSQASAATVDRSGLFGHHFTPAIEAVPEAIKRQREVVEEFEFWPQCPQFWEVAGSNGTAYRYCAHATGGSIEPPPRPCG